MSATLEYLCVCVVKKKKKCVFAGACACLCAINNGWEQRWESAVVGNGRRHPCQPRKNQALGIQRAGRSAGVVVVVGGVEEIAFLSWKSSAHLVAHFIWYSVEIQTMGWRWSGPGRDIWRRRHDVRKSGKCDPVNLNSLLYTSVIMLHHQPLSIMKMCH